jgi:prepilin-type N-terminal cleavage/methylation domain-containing protein
MQRNSSHNGFTLIELLVVITIIAILASIAFPVFTGVQEKAKVTQDLSNLRQIGLATQMYLNDNDNSIFSSNPSAGFWMAQLHPKYLPAWKIFQSPFDSRAPSELDASAPVSYGLNGNTKGTANPNSIAGLTSDKIQNASAFILFAPAQATGTTVKFSGTPAGNVTVYKNATPAASGGTHNRRTRINACFADIHVENLTWAHFINDNANDASDPDAKYRWDPYPNYP